jgi:hypothetical protein
LRNDWRCQKRSGNGDGSSGLQNRIHGDAPAMEEIKHLV